MKRGEEEALSEKILQRVADQRLPLIHRSEG